MNFEGFPLKKEQEMEIFSDINYHKVSTKSSSPRSNIDKQKESRERRNKREKKRQQHLQKLMRVIEEQVNANKPKSEHVFSQRLILDRAIKIIRDALDR